ncbi:hypothetical protein HDU93_000916, partial [Gonapodya sp. JEL0774]
MSGMTSTFLLDFALPDTSSSGRDQHSHDSQTSDRTMVAGKPETTDSYNPFFGGFTVPLKPPALPTQQVPEPGPGGRRESLGRVPSSEA